MVRNFPCHETNGSVIETHHLLIVTVILKSLYSGHAVSGLSTPQSIGGCRYESQMVRPEIQDENQKCFSSASQIEDHHPQAERVSGSPLDTCEHGIVTSHRGDAEHA